MHSSVEVDFIALADVGSSRGKRAKPASAGVMVVFAGADVKFAQATHDLLSPLQPTVEKAAKVVGIPHIRKVPAAAHRAYQQQLVLQCHAYYISESGYAR